MLNFHKNKRLFRTQAAVLLVCVVSTVAFALPAMAPSPAFATDSLSGKSNDQLNSDLENIQKNLAAAQKDYDTAVKTLNVIATTITTLNGQIADQQAKITAQQAKITDYNTQIDTKKTQITQMDTDITDQNSNLNQRLRVMYETDNDNMLVVLFGSENIVDFLSNLDMIQTINKSDQNLLSEMQQKLSALETAKKDLETIQTQLVSEETALEQTQASLVSKKSQLATTEAAQKAIRDAAVENIAAMEASSKQIESELAARKTTWTYGGGALSWPVQGPITSTFGMRVDPATGVYALHAGIDIGVPYGTPVHAAADGVVISASWYGGYGNLVMIDNGSGIVTLYGHNQSFACSAGQVVARGQVISYAGSTGNSTGPHVHFEVRLNGVPQNPMNYL
ncbi:MAG: peptidoglycan DD-metalloendopeptidase family protein [Clostridiales bacterium]|nr:peptidoglycan DD-metalloendopeptidase family protein [Clostridiales bacterium]